jgi:hypothetical protein
LLKNVLKAIAYQGEELKCFWETHFVKVIIGE